MGACRPHFLQHPSYAVTEKYAYLSLQHVCRTVEVLNQEHANWPAVDTQAAKNVGASIDTSRFGHVWPTLRVIYGSKQ